MGIMMVMNTSPATIPTVMQVLNVSHCTAYEDDARTPSRYVSY